MSVEAVSTPNAEATAMALPAASESEIVALLKEQNVLLRTLVASLHPLSPDLDIALARAISLRITPTGEAQFVAVNTATAAFATGRTASEAALALNAPPEKTLTTRTGGRVSRLPSIRKVPS